MEDYKKRVLEERDELKKKVDKLNTFVNGEEFVEIGDSEQLWLGQQYLVMVSYLDILNIRITAFEG